VKVLYVCTELYPLLKTGGLADVGAALPAALQAEGCEVRVLLPAFAAIAAGVHIEGNAMALHAPGGPEVARTLHPAPAILSGRVRATGQAVYLLDAPALYQRPGGPYLDASGHDWPDNAERFALLGWAAAWIGLGADPRWQPDVVHAHDWHAGLAPLYLQLLARAGPRPASVFTIHNLAYQGIFPRETLAPLGLPESLFTIDGYEYHGHLSFMKAGLQFADALTTVSPRYAREITTPEQGCGLDGVLRQRADRLSGILNGVDYTVWNPAGDPLIGTPYDIDRMEGKAAARRALQGLLGLALRPDALVFGAVSRLSEQKGFHLVPEVLDELVAQGGQLVVLGSGDARIEASLRDAAARHPGQAALRVGYDEALAHRIIAGSDVLLVPSRFEPCGLTQLYALRYGTLPLVHGVGGLADTVVDSTPENLARGSASGFVFRGFEAESLRQALHRAFALHRRPASWTGVQRHGMQLRFDWRVAGQAYCALYQRVAARPGPRQPV
jgi:starch synthase